MKFIRSLAVLGVLLSTSMNAQLTRGYISGTVQDPNGGVMPDVAIRITNTATNINTESNTNSVGLYRFVAVEPGAYSVEFAKSGFETRRITNILVKSNQEVTLNQSLKIAQAATTVEVIEAPPGVELSKSSAGMVTPTPKAMDSPADPAVCTTLFSRMVA